MESKHITTHSRNIFFVGVLTTTFLATMWLLRDYLSVILLSFIFAVVVHPLYTFITEKLRFGRKLGTLITITIAFFLIVVPILLSVNLFFQEISQLASNNLINAETLASSLRMYVVTTNTFLSHIPFLNLKISLGAVEKFFAEFGGNISKYVLSRAVSIGTSSVQVIIKLVVFILLSYFTVPVLRDFKKYILRMSPLENSVDEVYIDRIVALITALIKSVFIIALAQGLVGALFLKLAGIDYLLTLTIMMFICSIIPMVGTGFVTIPIALFLLAQGDVVGGSTIIFGQVVFVSNIDNILRAALLSQDTSIHPAALLLGIIGGLQVFGALGLLYGPIIIILFITSLQIYAERFKN